VKIINAISTRGFALALLCLALGAQLTAAEPKLKVGAPAPALRFKKIFKGQAVETLDLKQSYIIECWATWCGPCRAAFPHLSALAKELEGKVIVVGVDVNETKSLEAVQQFVDQQGDRMAYTVVADPDKTVATNWLAAAGVGGIPFSFVVVGGKIAWMGHPEGLDARMVLSLASGKAVALESFEDLFKPVAKLRAEGKYAEAVTQLDAIVGQHPEFARDADLRRFYLLIEYDEPAAYRAARKLLEDDMFRNHESRLYSMARRLVHPDLVLKNRDWDLALAVSSRLNQVSPDPNPAYLWTLAEAQAGKHDYAKAIAMMETLFPIVDSHPAIKGDRKFYEGRLKAFQDAQQKAAALPKTAN
jgi:thiol-disulfide isomerase/thioredoxin